MSVIVRRKQGGSPDTSLGGLPAIMARVLALRGIAHADQMDHSLEGLERPDALPNIAKAAEIIADAVMADQSILIIGDYDADGATATAVMYRALTMMGSTRVQYVVPDRVRHGYGLSVGLIADWLETHQKPDLIITVDNGTSAIDGVRFARQEGINIVVTDHHLPGDVLPEANAIVNPNLRDSEFPSKAMAGVGVSFYTMAAVRRVLKGRDWFSGRAFPDIGTLLDLVALGTVADVVPLDQNNRRLVAGGLARIREGRVNPGIAALVRVSKRHVRSLTTSDFGFAIGPRLNAAGRLESMQIGIDCLVTDDADQALKLAKRLHEINEERRTTQAKMMETIGHGVNMPDQDRPADPTQWVVHDQSFHQGLIGIVAGNLKEKWNCPVFAFAATDDGLMKGSGRSVDGLHLRDVLVDMDRDNPGLFRAFGGHAMAAGVTIKAENMELFRSAFARALSGREFSQVREVKSDGDLPLKSMTLKMALAFETMTWGAQFEEPVFDQVFEILDRKPLKDGLHWRLTLRPKSSKREIEAIWFNIGDGLPKGDSAHLVYRLSVNRFIGNESLQLMVVDEAA